MLGLLLGYGLLWVWLAIEPVNRRDWLLENVLNKIEIHEAATAFRTGASILDNAARHAYGGAQGPIKVQASVQRTAVYQAFRKLYQRFDVLAAPRAQVFPFAAGERWPREIAGVAMDTYHRWMEIVTPFTMAGLPVASVPVGFGAAGLPMGLQLAGPPRADLAVLSLAHAFEAIAPWSGARPPALAALA